MSLFACLQGLTHLHRNPSDTIRHQEEWVGGCLPILPTQLSSIWGFRRPIGHICPHVELHQQCLLLLLNSTLPKERECKLDANCRHSLVLYTFSMKMNFLINVNWELQRFYCTSVERCCDDGVVNSTHPNGNERVVIRFCQGFCFKLSL